MSDSTNDPQTAATPAPAHAKAEMALGKKPENYCSYKPGMQVFGGVIKKTMYATEKFVVYLNEQNEVWYEYDPEYYKTLSVPAQQLVIQADVAQSQPLGHLSNSNRESFLATLGNAIISGLSNDDQGGWQILKKAEDYLTRRNQELAKLPYFITTFVFMVIMLAAYWMANGFFGLNSKAPQSQTNAAATVTQTVEPTGSTPNSTTNNATASPEKKTATMAVQEFSWVVAGCIGAYFSLLSRLNVVATDPAAHWRTHVIDASSRMIIGCIGGYIGALAVDSGLLFSVLAQAKDDHTKFNLIFLLAMIAGASERLIPNFVDSMDSKTDNKPNSAPVPPPTNTNTTKPGGGK